MVGMEFCCTLVNRALVMLVVVFGCASKQVEFPVPGERTPQGFAPTSSVAQHLAVEAPNSATPGIAELFDWRLSETVYNRPTRVAVLTNTYFANAPVKCWIEKVTFYRGGKNMHHAVEVKVVISADTNDYFLTNVQHPDVEPAWGGGIVVPQSAIRWSWTIGRRPFFRKAFQRLNSPRFSLNTAVHYSNLDDLTREDWTSRFTAHNYWQPNHPPCINVVADIGLADHSTMASMLNLVPSAVPEFGASDEPTYWMAWTLAERHCIAQAVSGPCGRD